MCLNSPTQARPRVHAGLDDVGGGVSNGRGRLTGGTLLRLLEQSRLSAFEEFDKVSSAISGVAK